MNLGEHSVIGDRFVIANPAADQIGYGSMGIVYRGRDRQTGDDVAVKVLRMDALPATDDMIDRFVREGEALRLLEHPNIVKVIDTIHEPDPIADQDGAYYLVMEYAAGGTLRDLLAQQGHIPLEQTLEIGLDLSDALARAHRIGVIHRDIKPGNVLLTADGRPLLTDFGLALLTDRSSLTQPGALMGTVGYLSPEACNGEPLDELSDIWSFGILLWEMLTDQPPFLGQTIGATLAAIISNSLPDLQAARPEVPDRLAQLLVYMLQKERQQRLSSMRLVGAELEAILAGRAWQPWDAMGFETQYPLAESSRDGLETLTGQKAISHFIAQSRERGESILDRGSLTYAYTIQEDLLLDEDEAAVLLQSALTYGEPAEPWLAALSSVATICRVLQDFYDKYPRPETRCRIVENLEELPGEASDELLLTIAYHDDAATVRSRAALLCAGRGYRQQVTSHSLSRATQGHDTVALATLAALADVYGLPRGASFYLKLQIMLILARQRWLANRQLIWHQSVRAMLGGGLIAFYGLAVPAVMRATAPSVYEITLSYMTLPAYHVISIILFGVYGLLQGLSVGFLAGLVDALQPGNGRSRWRPIGGAIAGLLYSLAFYAVTVLGNDDPLPQKGLILWGNILYGLLLGILLVRVIPHLVSARTRREQAIRMISSAVFAAAAVIPYALIAYSDTAQNVYPSRLVLSVMLPLAIGLPFLRLAVPMTIAPPERAS